MSLPQLSPYRSNCSFDQLILSATAAFEAGALTFNLPWKTEGDPVNWNPVQVRIARLLVRSPESDEIARTYAEERGFPPDVGDGTNLSPETLQTYRTWTAPLADLLWDVKTSLEAGRADFQLTTEMTNYACWVMDSVVLPVTARVGVLCIRGLTDSWLPYPVPLILVDRSRLLRATSVALGEQGPGWPPELDGFSMQSTHSAIDVYRLLLGRVAGEGVWSMPDGKLPQVELPGVEWGYADLAAVLAEGSEHFRLASACVSTSTPAHGSVVELVTAESVKKPRQIGWLCTLPIAGQFVLCLECGGKHRPGREQVSRGSSVPLTIDDVHPQSQRCARCRRGIAESIVEDVSERFPIRFVCGEDPDEPTGTGRREVRRVAHTDGPYLQPDVPSPGSGKVRIIDGPDSVAIAFGGYIPARKRVGPGAESRLTNLSLTDSELSLLLEGLTLLEDHLLEQNLLGPPAENPCKYGHATDLRARVDTVLRSSRS